MKIKNQKSKNDMVYLYKLLFFGSDGSPSSSAPPFSASSSCSCDLLGFLPFFPIIKYKINIK